MLAGAFRRPNLGSAWSRSQEGRHGWRAVGALAVAILLCLVLPSRAAAHPSDLDTLTLDFLITSEGLQAIDAAVRPQADSFPTETLRLEVAREILGALQPPVSADDVQIQTDVSERYHEVGFEVHFPVPSLGHSEPITLAAADLQEIAAEHGMSTLKVSVCVADATAQGHEGVLAELDVRASQDSRAPVGQERTGCAVWSTQETNSDLTIVVGSSSGGELAATGFASWALILSLATIAFGGLSLVVSRVRCPKT